ncbi:MAG: hypothetical protein ABTR27_11835, partial [Candidatus Competibacter phosphatis]
MKRLLFVGLLSVGVLPSFAIAVSPAEQLAIDSYRHLVSYESLLDGAIRSGDKRDFERFIEKPTREIASRW